MSRRTVGIASAHSDNLADNPTNMQGDDRSGQGVRRNNFVQNKRHAKLQQELQQSIERYELLSKATNDIIYDIDLYKNAVIWNEALFLNYGYSRSEDTNKLEWWASHIHSEDALRVENELSALLKSDLNTWQSQYRFRKATGEYAIVHDRAFVQRAKDGQPQRIIGSLLDVTESVRLERAKDEFTSLISHQLRTPLTVIQFYSTMLSDGLLGPLEPAQLEHVRRINAASIRLIKLVGNILNISRIELDRIRLDTAMADISELTQEIVTELQPIAQEKNIRIKYNSGNTLPPVRIDKSIFCEVLINLLTNAIYYTPNGGKVEVLLSHDERGYLLRVRDNGIGIPVLAQSSIFSRFYRADNAVQTGSEGTGLGLYLSKLIMEAVGGDLSFRSTEGKGTTFYFRLPADGMVVRKRAPSSR